MKRFKSALVHRLATVPVGVQRHLAALSAPVGICCRPPPSLHEMADRFTVWNQITGVATTAA